MAVHVDVRVAEACEVAAVYMIPTDVVVRVVVGRTLNEFRFVGSPETEGAATKVSGNERVISLLRNPPRKAVDISKLPLCVKVQIIVPSANFTYFPLAFEPLSMIAPVGTPEDLTYNWCDVKPRTT